MQRLVQVIQQVAQDAGYLLRQCGHAAGGVARFPRRPLLAAINNPEQAASLDRFPLWREAIAIPLDDRLSGTAPAEVPAGEPEAAVAAAAR